jgi:hypothetical protein
MTDASEPDLLASSDKTTESLSYMELFYSSLHRLVIPQRHVEVATSIT